VFVYVVMWLAVLMPCLVIDKQRWKNFDRNYAIYAFICLLVLIGCRDISVGTDTSTYAFNYSIASEKVETAQRDKGYFVFANLFNLMGFDFQVYLIIVSSIMVFALIWFYSTYSANLSFSILIFMTIGLLSMYMSGIRQSLAISLGLCAMLWSDKHKGVGHVIVSCVLVWLASQLHASAVICYMAVFFIVLRLRFSRQTIFLLVLISSAALIYRNQLAGFVQKWLPIEYGSYDLFADYQINPLLIIISILIPAFCIVFDTGLDGDGRYSCQKTWMYVFSCVNILFTILARNSMYFSRVAFYFLHINSLVIPNMIAEQRLGTNKLLMYIIIGSVCAAYFLISIPGGVLQIDNYRFFWQVP